MSTGAGRTLGYRARRGAKRLLGERRKKVLLYERARWCERVGIRRYSWPGWNGLDRRLVAWLGYARNGTFVEAGANDGFAQSNTYHLQRYLGWTGLLVEPVPELADLCRRFRPGADVREVALCDRSTAGSTVRLRVHDLTTHVEEADAAPWSDDRPAILVPCDTLASVVRAAGLDRVDLLSLDVEGFELSALDGMDDSMPRPRHILVETRRPDEVAHALRRTHRHVAQLSHHDYLFEAR